MMQITIELNKMTPEMALPDSWDTKDYYRYILLVCMNPEFDSWIMNHIPESEILPFVLELDTFLDLNKRNNEPNMGFLRAMFKRLSVKSMNQIQKMSVLEQLNYAGKKTNVSAYETVEYYKELIKKISTVEECCLCIECLGKKQYKLILPILEQHMIKNFKVEDYFEIFRLDKTWEHVKRIMVYEMRNVFDAMNKKGFSAKDVLDGHIEGSGYHFNIVDTLPLDKVWNKKISYYGQQSLVTLNDMNLLRNARYHKSKREISSWMGGKNPLIFYKEQAIKHGFIDEFYCFMLNEGDALFQQEESYTWDHSRECLKSTVVKYMIKNQASVASWHPNIQAVIEGKPIDPSITMTPRLAGVLNEYIKESHPSAKSVIQLLGLKTKHVYLQWWNSQFEHQPHQEIELNF